MKIAYRRMSGAIGISNFESGTRGMWWEKRLAFVNWLKSRGHQVNYVNRMTKFSPQVGVPFLDGFYDLLIIEFGSSNQVFYHNDLGQTADITNRHHGPIIFLCDDPDLPYQWKTFNGERQQFKVWSNCLRPELDKTVPAGVPTKDFPFSALQSATEGEPTQQAHFVYIGRPGGRSDGVKTVLEANVPLHVYAKEAEWKKFPTVVPSAPPAQTERRKFYHESFACLALADSKHKRLGWRTGRAYHAALAGCPVVAEADHDALAGFQTYATAAELRNIYDNWLDPRARLEAVERQKLALADDRAICEQRAREMGL